MLTEREIDAIRFYQGDVRRRTKDGTYSEQLTEPGFYGIPGAYRTMNCLMFEGIENEKERLAEKAGSLNPQIYLEIEKVVDVFCDIFRAMCKSTVGRKDSARIIAYRTDWGISVEEMRKQGQTISFTSTSKENCPEEYFRRKRKLTLLEIVIPSGVPYLDFEKILGSDYHYASQREILLPPFFEC